jgi:DNA-binding transcriptional MerR regulator
MSKSAQAFRTIREVADWLDVAAHVLRFWESKFHQIKPVKRAGGRRYYRPADMELVGGIKVLLHDRGMTIRGVQKMMADEGLEAICALSPPIDDLLDNPNVVQLDPADAWDMDAETEALEQEERTETEPADGADISAQTDAEDEDEGTDAADIPSPQEPDLPAAATPDMFEPQASPESPAPSPEVSAPPVAPRPDMAKPAPFARIESDPAEGQLGRLAAIATLPVRDRARLAPQIAALSRLRDRMAGDQSAA